MEPEVYVSPDGASMQVASPAVAVRMRARGWLPESEVVAEPEHDNGGTLPPAVSTSVSASAEPVVKPPRPRRKPAETGQSEPGNPKSDES